LDRLTGLESMELRQLFADRRSVAETAHVMQLAEDPDASLTVRESRNVGRNDPCPCGSKVKFKKCCGRRLADDDERVAD
jgi:uncharacterized protein YecA (UPF0149 family)